MPYPGPMDEFSVWHTALRVRCDYCDAQPGVACRSQSGAPLTRGMHGSRWEEARETVRLRMAHAVEQMILPFE